MDETHTIIRTANSGTVLRHVENIKQCTGLHLLAALKRRQYNIFVSVLKKSKTFLPAMPFYLLQAPPKYLLDCVKAGMPTDGKKHGESLLEIAVRKRKKKHVRILLQNNAPLSKTATYGIIKHMKQYLNLLFAKGLPASPSYVYYAIKHKNTSLLQGALKYLEKEEKWAKVAEYLTCPILNTPTADIVQTPQGQIYDKQCITQWINNKHTDPLTREHLYITDLLEVDVTDKIKQITL